MGDRGTGGRVPDEGDVPTGRVPERRFGLLESGFALAALALLLVAAGLTVDVGFERRGSVRPPEPPASEAPAADTTIPPPPLDLTPGEEDEASPVTVQLLDAGAGPGVVDGVAVRLMAEGVRVVATNQGRPRDRSLIYFTAGFDSEGRALGVLLGIDDVRPMEELPVDQRLSSAVMVHVIIGAR